MKAEKWAPYLVALAGSAALFVLSADHTIAWVRPISAFLAAGAIWFQVPRRGVERGREE